MPPSPYVRALRARIGNELLMMPSVDVMLFDTDGRLLLAKSATNDFWMTIGGAIDPEEAPADAAVRECWEETGLLIEPVRLIGVFGGPVFHFSYENGDEVAYSTIAFEARRIGGEPRPDGVETSELRFVAAEDARALPMAPHIRVMVNCAFGRREQPYFAPPTWKPG